MDIVSKYKKILDQLYAKSFVSRTKDEKLREELAELWDFLSKEGQDQVQNYSLNLRKSTN